MTDSIYYDKVYGGWLGKCLGGAAGAPVEGIKKLIPCEDFREMIRPDLPNDDLDLQLLWMEVLWKKGRNVTAADLAEAWDRQCWYPFNEYGIFLKNYERGILPPYSGSFNNPVFSEGEGCPIRSEIWGMVFPEDPDTAAAYAGMDGSLDHAGEAVWIEQYYAAVEAVAFTGENICVKDADDLPETSGGAFLEDTRAFSEDAMETLLKSQLYRLPENSRGRACVELVLEAFHEKQCDWRKARTRMLRKFGHFDFTNAVTNLGITVIALLYGGEDLWKVINIAFRCGFDTDCTCATAAAVWGIRYGAGKIPEELKGLVNDRFVVGIDLERTDSSIKKLAVETCRLGKRLTVETCGPEKRLAEETCGAEKRVMSQEETKALAIDVIYEKQPAIGIDDRCGIGIRLRNHFEAQKEWKVHIAGLPVGWSTIPEEHTVVLEPGQEKTAEFVVLTSKDVKRLYSKNLLEVIACNEAEEFRHVFGIAGASEWTAAGPYFENLEKEDPPGTPSAHGADCILPTLECMVNNAVYLEKEYIDEHDFVHAFMSEETCRVHGYEDLLPLDDTFEFRGQGCIYLKQRLISATEQDVWAVIGNNDGFRLWINGEMCMERDEIRLWTPYNNYQVVHLKKGENEVVVKVLKRTESMKFGIAFRKYEGEHFHRKRWCVDLGCAAVGCGYQKK